MARGCLEGNPGDEKRWEAGVRGRGQLGRSRVRSVKAKSCVNDESPGNQRACGEVSPG